MCIFSTYDNIQIVEIRFTVHSHRGILFLIFLSLGNIFFIHWIMDLLTENPVKGAGIKIKIKLPFFNFFNFVILSKEWRGGK